mgnify:CR=1 FL=1
MRNDFISAYFQYVGDTEAPMTFHRWACISVLGAWIGRDYSFKFGHSSIKPNIYCMLMGNAGTRKTTAIRIASKLIAKAGYHSIAADRTTKEKFLMDLSGAVDFVPTGRFNRQSADEIMEQNLFGEKENHIPEVLIAADEFNTFIGNGNIEFLSMLGVLWDHEGPFENKVKNSKSVKIDDPFVSIIAGNTPTGFSLAFPAESIGQGIFSRLVLVHGESPGKKITFPVSPPAEKVREMIDLLHAIKSVAKGQARTSPDAEKLLDSIYQSGTGMNDVRFEAYMNRRFTHLIKICLILSASALRNTIEESDVLYGNTILTHTEHSMSKALGEFGKARHSDVSHKLVQILENRFEPITVKELWMQLHNDLDDMGTMKDMLSNLITADRILSTKTGFLAKRKVVEEKLAKYVDFSLLTEEERKHIT